MENLEIIEVSQILTVEQLAEKLTEISEKRTSKVNLIVEYIVDDNRAKFVNKRAVIQKHVKVHGFLNMNYETQMRKETNNPKFKAEPLMGKTRINKNLLKSNATGQMLLFAIIDKYINKEKVEQLQRANLGYYHNGKKVDMEYIKENNLFKESSQNTPEIKPVNVINPALESIYRIYLNHIWFYVV